MADNKNEIKYPTLKDVAELSGVSPITVSRVFNEKWEGRVKEETVHKVLTAARKLDYSPNQIARSLNGERTNIIAVVTGLRTGIFYDELLHNLTTKIQKNGKQALIFVADPSYGIERIVEQVNQFRVDAIIVTSPALKSEIMNFFSNTKRPIVLFNRYIEQSTASAVWSDGVFAMKKLVYFLLENGYKDIAFLTGPSEGIAELERDATFITALANGGIPPIKVINGDYTYKSGYNAAFEFFKGLKKPDVIVCSGDNMAFGVMDALKNKLGLHVPEDVSVIGYDDNPVAKLDAYDLTTIKQPFDIMIDATIDTVNKLLEDPKKQILLSFDTELIIRGSTRKNVDFKIK